MNEYARWAEEYKKSADLTKAKIDELEQKRRSCKSVSLTDFYNRKLMTLYEMYGDCMLAHRELLRKSKRVKEGW